MITVSNPLTLEDYIAANKSVLLHSTLGKRLNYIFCVYVLPVAGVILLILGTIFAYISITQGTQWIMTVYSFVFGGLALFAPIRFQSKFRKYYDAQNLKDMHLKFDSSDIYFEIVGQSKSEMKWSYFTTYLETKQMFIAFERETLRFIAIPKSRLSAVEELEVSAILGSNLKRR